MDITKIVSLALELVVTILIMFVLPYVKGLLNEKIGYEKTKKLMFIVETFVSAAEQLFDVDQSAAKKAYVLQKLHDNGLDIDSALLDSMIEAAVLELHNAMGCE